MPDCDAQAIVDLLRSAQPVLTYDDRRVSPGDLDLILEAVRWTPSAANLQPWELLLLETEERKAALVDATLDPMLRDDGHGKQDWIVCAPHVLVFCADMRRVRARFGEGADRIAPLDVSASVLAAIVTARALGVSCCWVREFDPVRLRECMSIPRFFLPVAILTLGYSDAEVSAPPTLETAEFLHRETW